MNPNQEKFSSANAFPHSLQLFGNMQYVRYKKIQKFYESTAPRANKCTFPECKKFIGRRLKENDSLYFIFHVSQVVVTILIHVTFCKMQLWSFVDSSVQLQM